MNDHGAFARVQKTSVTAHFDNTAEKVQEKYAHELARYEHEVVVCGYPTCNS